MKKRSVSLLFIAVLMSLSRFTTYGSTVELNTTAMSNSIVPAILIDGKPINLSSYSIHQSEEGIYLYPLRLVAENLDFEVSWDRSTGTARMINSKDEIFLTPETKTVIKNEASKNLKYNVEVIDSGIYVPINFISEILGERVLLDSRTMSINLQKPLVGIESLDLSPTEEEIKSNLVAYLTSLELNRDFSGQILVEREGNILVYRSYGYSDYENQIKALNTTTFAIGSVTKQIVAAAIVQLAEQNKLSLQDKVSEYISDVPFGDQISIHQLLTHTSGSYEYTNDIAQLFGTEFSEMSFDEFIDLIENNELEFRELNKRLEVHPSQLTFNEIIALVENKPLSFEPGTDWKYCNTGYLILGEIIERVSGESLIDYLEEYIFIPAGMENTGLTYNSQGKLVEANGYLGNTLDYGDEILLNIIYGAGYLASTAYDLYQWNVALQTGEIVSMEGVSKIFGKHPEIKLSHSYGYGWLIEESEYGEKLSHNGGTFGFTALNTLFTEKNTQIIILTNKAATDLSILNNNIMSILNGRIIAPLEEVQYIDLSEEVVESYIGEYETKGILKIDIFTEDGNLVLQREGQSPVELNAVSETEFDSPFGIAIKFDRKENPTQFTLFQNGLEFIAVKITD